MVSNASDDLPEPDTPVTTVNVLCGTSKSTFLRLWTRAPRTTMLCVEMLSVADGEAESQQHDADGGREHDKDGAVERPLCFLGRSLRSRIAHGAALGECRR